MEIFIISLAVFVGFTVQTALGFAAGLTSLPILLLALPLPQAVATITIFNFVFACIQLPKKLPDMDRDTILPLIPAKVVGICIGVYLLSYGSPTILKKALGVFILIYVVYRLRGGIKCSISKLLGNILSFTTGFFAGLFSSGAPPMVVYMSSKFEDDPVKMRANLIGILSVSNFLRPVLFIVTGLLTKDIFLNSLPAFAAFVLALYLGERAFKKFDKELFAKIVYGFLALSGISMLLK